MEVDGRDVAESAGEWRWATDGDTVAGTVVAGNHFVRCTYTDDTVPIGPSTAPRAAGFWSFADRELGTTIGPLT